MRALFIEQPFVRNFTPINPIRFTLFNANTQARALAHSFLISDGKYRCPNEWPHKFNWTQSEATTSKNEFVTLMNRFKNWNKLLLLNFWLWLWLGWQQITSPFHTSIDKFWFYFCDRCSLCWKVKITIAKEWICIAELYIDTLRNHFNSKVSMQWNVKRSEQKHSRSSANTLPFCWSKWNSFIENRWLFVGKVLWPSNLVCLVFAKLHQQLNYKQTNKQPYITCECSVMQQTLT